MVKVIGNCLHLNAVVVRQISKLLTEDQRELDQPVLLR